jgi:hypothetical protein
MTDYNDAEIQNTTQNWREKKNETKRASHKDETLHPLQIVNFQGMLNI